MRPLGLRARVALAFGAGSLVLSTALATATFSLTSRSALEVRERASVRSAYGDARVVRQALLVPESDVVEALRSLDTGRSRLPLLRRDGQWFARTADDGLTEAVPAALLRQVEAGRPSLQRVQAQGHPALVLGIPLDTPGEAYFEVDALTELDRTLHSLGNILTLVAAGTTVAGLALGAWAARRLLQPLQEMSAAAGRISSGDLDARLQPPADRDLAPLSRSFNAMVDDLAARLRRDRRFAADVSHELRSPLQTLANASSVLQRRAADLDPRARAAAELVQDEVERFSALVADLLELAREDVPVDAVEADVAGLVREEAGRRGLPDDVLDLTGAPTSWCVEVRRLRGVVRNLLDNATQHGGGVVGVRLAQEADQLVLEVDDAGPGVPVDERELVFDRFGRGRRSSSRRDGEGTGLGLSLVAAQVAAHGGGVEVDDRPGGGARFRVRLPSGGPA